MFDELWSEIADAPGEIYDVIEWKEEWEKDCLLYTSPSPRDVEESRMPSSA